MAPQTSSLPPTRVSKKISRWRSRCERVQGGWAVETSLGDLGRGEGARMRWLGTSVATGAEFAEVVPVEAAAGVVEGMRAGWEVLEEAAAAVVSLGVELQQPCGERC